MKEDALAQKQRKKKKKASRKQYKKDLMTIRFVKTENENRSDVKRKCEPVVETKPYVHEPNYSSSQTTANPATSLPSEKIKDRLYGADFHSRD